MININFEFKILIQISYVCIGLYRMYTYEYLYAKTRPNTIFELNSYQNIYTLFKK